MIREDAVHILWTAPTNLSYKTMKVLLGDVGGLMSMQHCGFNWLCII